MLLQQTCTYTHTSDIVTIFNISLSINGNNKQQQQQQQRYRPWSTWTCLSQGICFAIKRSIFFFTKTLDKRITRAHTHTIFVCAVQYAPFECMVSNDDGDKNPTNKCHNVIECTFIGFESQNASQFGIDSKCLLIVRFFCQIRVNYRWR